MERCRTASQSPHDRRRGLLVLGIMLAAGILLVGGAGVLSQHLTGSSGRPAARAGPARASPSARTGPAGATRLPAAALVQRQAAGWIAQQVSDSAIVACDPAMCSVLRSQGLPAARLLALRMSAASPRGADVVVATPAVRRDYGDRLAGVYAPLVIASFGAGQARIDIRAVVPGGAAALDARLEPDRGARTEAGDQLLRNQNITATPAAQAVLRAGQVDPRLLIVLATLAGQQQVSIIAFGDPSPGAAAMPLRSAQIGAASPAGLRLMLSFLYAQQPPYHPALASALGKGQDKLKIQFDAPSPMGLLRQRDVTGSVTESGYP